MTLVRLDDHRQPAAPVRPLPTNVELEQAFIETPDPFAITPEIEAAWEAYAIAKQKAEDSLLLRDGIAAAKAFYHFVETFMPGALIPHTRRNPDA